MKVRAVQDGLAKYYRTAGDVFEWPWAEDDKDHPIPLVPDGWVEKVDEDTPNRMQETGEKAPVFECPDCGYITVRRSKFCPDCGYNAQVIVDAQAAEKARADAIEGIQGKGMRPEEKKIKPKLVTPHGVVNKDKQV